jgi:hypothetical protein
MPDSQGLDVPKIQQIEVRENISTVSPKLIGMVEIERKKSLSWAFVSKKNEA